MNRALKIAELRKRFGDSIQVFRWRKIFGLIPIKLFLGWLWIEERDDYWSLSLASGKSSNNHFWSGPVYGADFRKDNGNRKIGPLGLTGAWKSALSMWPILEERKASQVFALISSRVDLAYQCYFNGK